MLSLILPTFNESKNVPALVPALEGVLKDMPHEIIIVDDDSPDGTWKIAEDLTKTYPSLKVLRRVGRKGLSSAVVEGFDMAKGEVLMVMDSDGQHDLSLVPALYREVKNGKDIVVASRYAKGGGMGGWGGFRLMLSKTATFLARKLPNVEVSDPMSGFFAVDAKAYRAVAAKLHPRGFKILLEVLSYLPGSSAVGEVPMTFGLRKAGESKLTLKVQLEFLAQLAGIARRRLMSPWGVFLIACLVIGLVLAWRTWPIRALYTDAQVRSQAQAVLQEATTEKGWLLSGVSFEEVRSGYLRVTYRQHTKGEDPRECAVFRLPSADAEPCES